MGHLPGADVVALLSPGLLGNMLLHHAALQPLTEACDGPSSPLPRDAQELSTYDSKRLWEDSAGLQLIATAS